MGAHFHTCPATGTGVRIHKKDPIFNLNGIFRAIVGAHPALVAQMDAVIARSRKAGFDTQHRFRRVDFLEVFDGTGQPADAAAGTILVKSFQFQ